MHKNPMIQLEFFCLSQSCHLELQEGTFICIPQWQSFCCKCLLVEDCSTLSGSRSLAACPYSSAGSSPDDQKFDGIFMEKIA